MDTITLGLIALALLFLLMFAGLPVGYALGLVGFLGSVAIVGLEGSFGIIRNIAYSSGAHETLSVIPLFVLMGQFAFYSGIVEDLYYAMHKWIGQLRGGLAMSTVCGCAGFAAICGSSLAVSSTMTKTALPEMRKYNYNPKLAAGCIAAGGALGILIPPSVALIVYGIITETSIGKLFLAGILPGILVTVLLCLTIYIMAKLRPEMGPPGPKSTWREKFMAGKNVWPVLLLFSIVMGGIWSGIFTPTEAAAIGACGTLLLSLFKNKLNAKNFIKSFRETIRITGMIFSIVIGAMIFNFFLALSKLPIELSSFISTLNLPPMMILVFILLVFLLLGCLMDTLAMTLLVLPIVFPTVTALGFHPVWFGVIVTVMAEIGQITPPIGINVFIISGVARDIPMYTIFRGIAPFLVSYILAVSILILFPEISLVLSNL